MMFPALMKVTQQWWVSIMVSAFRILWLILQVLFVFLHFKMFYFYSTANSICNVKSNSRIYKSGVRYSQISLLFVGTNLDILKFWKQKVIKEEVAPGDKGKLENMTRKSRLLFLQRSISELSPPSFLPCIFCCCCFCF